MKKEETFFKWENKMKIKESKMKKGKIKEKRKNMERN